ncbi:acetyl esterase [Xylariomycetidae sp. FL0641]|nr:acetyl esterase [Xylariomycetidae sp. FL0641]
MLRSALLFAIPIAGLSVRSGLTDVKNLIFFGDSYTDEGRLAWFQSHNGSAPPAGTVIPVSNFSSSGSYVWPHFAAETLGAERYNYAVSGAVCSNELVSRYLESIDAPFPSVLEYEVPAFAADLAASTNGSSGGGSKRMFADRPTAADSVYALWIGTNDLGVDAYLTDSQRPGATLTDFAECIWAVFDGLYATGARRLVLLNQAPLDRAPAYASPEAGGAGNNQYWADKTAHNTTEYAQKMREYTAAVNALFDYGAPFQLIVRRRWPGASVRVLDVHALMEEIIAEPETYLDAPADVSASYHSCPADASGELACTDSDKDLTSFLWYDELHPAVRTDEIIAEEFVKLLNGTSTYGSYY